MSTRGIGIRLCRQVLTGLLVLPTLLALDSREQLTQYTHATWTVAQGLPQDTIRSIAQTDDGYLWVGTNEGLARFDGYDFTIFNRSDNSLPNPRISKLYAGRNGNLWIGTMGGLVRYSKGKFKTYTAKDGLTPGKIDSLIEDSAGVVWVISDENLNYLNTQSDQFVQWPRKRLQLKGHPTAVYEDRDHELWVASAGSLLKRTGDAFLPVLGPEKLSGDSITSLLKDDSGLWIGGTAGILLLRPDGSLDRFTVRDGLPDDFVRVLLKDRSGNLWAGTYGGLSRFERGRFTASRAGNKEDSDWIWCLFEDREGDLWIGTNSSLTRLSNSRFHMYGRPEGIPGDGANVVQIDSSGQVWAGYHSNGLVALTGSHPRVFTRKDGLPSDEIFSLRNTTNGDFLIATRNGLSRMRGESFLNYSVPDPLDRKSIFSALETEAGHLFAANSSGVYALTGSSWKPVALGHPEKNDFAVILERDHDGTIWAGTLGSGLEEIVETSRGPQLARTYTVRDGLGSNEIRALYADPDGTLWIGTLGAGLVEFEHGRFHNYSARDGLSSESISHIQDDGRGSLWLSMTTGISRVSKSQLREFRDGKAHRLTPETFGLADGLRSTQCAPGAPAGSGATQTPDGQLWFPTSGGVASIDPLSGTHSSKPPLVHLLSIDTDGHSVDASSEVRIEPGVRRIRFRYTGIHLSAPEQIRYAYKFEGLDNDWIPLGSRRVLDYGPLPHGRYRFLVRASLGTGQSSDTSIALDVRPYFFQSASFLCLCVLSMVGVTYGAYRFRLNVLHAKFALVSAERARLAREIHDTLAQGLVGISGQLNAVANSFISNPVEARRRLDLARRMAQHSLAEAKRSVIDLRATEPPDQDLQTSLSTAANRCAAGNPVRILTGIQEVAEKLTADLRQNLLRIVEEGVTNAVKHADASTIRIDLAGEHGFLKLSIRDDGKGFEPARAQSAAEGHFGIVGIQERAERLGGTMTISSRVGGGTELEVKIPLRQKRAPR